MSTFFFLSTDGISLINSTFKYAPQITSVHPLLVLSIAPFLRSLLSAVSQHDQTQKNREEVTKGYITLIKLQVLLLIY